MLYKVAIVSHVMLAVFLVILVLIQRGKGSDMGSGFGAGASGTVFGARGSASFFSRATGVLAALFFFASLGLAYLTGQQTGPESIVAPAVEETTGAVLTTDQLPEEPQEGELPALPDLPEDEPAEEPSGEDGS